MFKNSLRLGVFVCMLSTVTACSSGEAGSDAATSETAVATGPTLSDAAAIGLRNAKTPLERLVTGGQPTPEQLEGLVQAGFAHFISLRPAAEDGAGWEESGVGDGATFARIPISGSGDLTRENVEALDRLLSETGDEHTVLYCASSNRVGALLALRAAWLQDMPVEQALELGREAGMTRLEGAVTELLAGEN